MSIAFFEYSLFYQQMKLTLYVTIFVLNCAMLSPGTTYAIASSGRDSTVNMMTNLRNGLKNFGLDNACANISIFWCVKSAQASMRLFLSRLFSQDLDLCCGVPTDITMSLKYGKRVLKILE